MPSWRGRPRAACSTCPCLELHRTCSPCAPALSSRSTFSPPHPATATPWPWCWTARVWMMRPCSTLRGGPTCLKPPSCCRPPTRRPTTRCASSRRAGSCPLPATPRWARALRGWRRAASRSRPIKSCSNAPRAWCPSGAKPPRPAPPAAWPLRRPPCRWRPLRPASWPRSRRPWAWRPRRYSAPRCWTTARNGWACCWTAPTPCWPCSLTTPR